MSDDIIEAEFWRGEVHRFDMRPYLGFFAFATPQGFEPVHARAC
ncbi:MAG: hypothetical protein WBH99_08465 [Azovibrio sp.]